MSDEIGPNIRRRRQSRGWSLDSLAKASGVSATMLSEVERSVKNPTVKLAYQIARALGCTLTELLGEEPVPQVSIVRALGQHTFIDPETGVERTGWRSDLLNRHLEVARYILPPDQSTGEMAPNRTGLVEMVIVLKGTLDLVLSGEHHRLNCGDSATYGVQTLNYLNASDQEECVFLMLSDASRVF